MPRPEPQSHHNHRLAIIAATQNRISMRSILLSSTHKKKTLDVNRLNKLQQKASEVRWIRFIKRQKCKEPEITGPAKWASEFCSVNWERHHNCFSVWNFIRKRVLFFPLLVSFFFVVVGVVGRFCRSSCIVRFAANVLRRFSLFFAWLLFHKAVVCHLIFLVGCCWCYLYLVRLPRSKLLTVSLLAIVVVFAVFASVPSLKNYLKSCSAPKKKRQQPPNKWALSKWNWTIFSVSLSFFFLPLFAVVCLLVVVVIQTVWICTLKWIIKFVALCKCDRR